MIIDLAEFPGKLCPQPGIGAAADQPGSRNGCLDFMNPAFDIFPVVPLRAAGVGYGFDHGFARPAHQLINPAFIGVMGFGHTFGKQVLLIEHVHNGLQLIQVRT